MIKLIFNILNEDYILEVPECNHIHIVQRSINRGPTNDFIEVTIGDWTMYVDWVDDIWNLYEDYPASDDKKLVTSGNLNHVFATMNEAVKVSCYCN